MSDNEVIITLKEVYEQQQKQSTMQSEMNSKIDRLLDRHDRIDERVEDHESRMRTLEKRVWSIPSLSALIGIASLAVAIFKK